MKEVSQWAQVGKTYTGEIRQPIFHVMFLAMASKTTSCTLAAYFIADFGWKSVPRYGP